MRVGTHNSPNQNNRHPDATIRLIVLHANASAGSSVSHIMNPAAQVSYHDEIARNGDLDHLVPYAKRAWHAGRAAFLNYSSDDPVDINDISIGICFDNKNDGVEPYTPEQIKTGVGVVAALVKTYKIGLECICTHEQISRPVNRKSDPGVQFPLAAFITAVRKAAYP